MAKKQTQFRKRQLKRSGRRLRLLLLPLKENHYRPHLIRRYGLAAVLLLALGIQFAYNASHTGSVLGQVTTVTPAGLLLDTNAERANRQLPELSVNTKLTEAAANKADDMVTKGYWSHTAPDGSMPWAWLDGVGYAYQEAGENLAKNFSTAEATMAAWMSSSTHRENILKASYTEVGFAVREGRLNDAPITIIVAFYGRPVQQVAAHVASSVAQTVVQSGVDEPLTPATRIGVALQSLTPAAVTSLALLFVAATVAITAHIFRAKLPKQRRESWYKHHGAAKASGLLAVAAVIIVLYGGGQL